MNPESRLRIAVFIDFDNIEIGVKNSLNAAFDAGPVLEALKERGEVVSKTAYGDWQRAGGYSRQLTQHAIKMVQRNLTPGGDKNGADINLALDALEMAFTHPHINAFVIVGGDSDFISLVEKLKQYDKKVFVVGGRQFTSVIMQRNCHEFIAYENLMGAGARRPAGRGQPGERTAIDQAVPLVKRALKVLSEREVSPQLGLLKSTLLQLDSTFSERSYGAGSFRDFVDKLAESGVVRLQHGRGGVLVELPEGDGAAVPPMAAAVVDGKSADALPESARPDRDDRGSADHDGHASRGRGDHDHRQRTGGEPQAVAGAGRGATPVLAPVVVKGTSADGVREFTRILRAAKIARWPAYVRNIKQAIRQDASGFDERSYGFSNLIDLLRALQKEGVLRVERDRHGVLRIFQGTDHQAAHGAPVVPHRAVHAASADDHGMHDIEEDELAEAARAAQAALAAPAPEPATAPEEPSPTPDVEAPAQPAPAPARSRGRRTRTASARPAKPAADAAKRKAPTKRRGK